MKIQKKIGGGGWGVQGRCEQRSEVFVKIHFFFVLLGGGGSGRGGGCSGGSQGGCEQKLKFL